MLWQLRNAPNLDRFEAVRDGDSAAGSNASSDK
jgi:hypothetical protein